MLPVGICGTVQELGKCNKNSPREGTGARDTCVVSVSAARTTGLLGVQGNGSLSSLRSKNVSVWAMNGNI